MNDKRLVKEAKLYIIYNIYIIYIYKNQNIPSCHKGFGKPKHCFNARLRAHAID
jgi:hypothetical protein